jgi:hypothetical protein
MFRKWAGFIPNCPEFAQKGGRGGGGVRGKAYFSLKARRVSLRGCEVLWLLYLTSSLRGMLADIKQFVDSWDLAVIDPLDILPDRCPCERCVERYNVLSILYRTRVT